MLINSKKINIEIYCGQNFPPNFEHVCLRQIVVQFPLKMINASVHKKKNKKKRNLLSHQVGGNVLVFVK